VELHQRPHAARGALLRFFNSTGYEKRAVPRPLGAPPEGMGGVAELRRLLLPGGPGGGAKHVFSSFLKRTVPVDEHRAPRPNVYISWHK
jgi:hypothetical protein